MLALSALTPAHAAGTGTLTITMLDEHGDPMPGQIQVTDGDGSRGGGSFQQTSTASLPLPPGEYGVLTVSPWGGMLCAGLELCSYLSVIGGVGGLDGTVTVREGSTTEVVLRAEKPASLKGPATIGKKVEVRWSEGMKNLIDYFSMAGGGVYNPGVQWLRDGKAIADATDATYRPVGADAGRTVSARLVYPAVIEVQFEQITGEPLTERTTNGLKVTKVATRAFTTVADPTVSADRQGRVRVDVTAPNQIVTGQVKVTVGDWSQTRSLRNGSARIVLPRLAPGRHTVTARYLGTSVYAPSTAKAKSITVG